MLQLPTYSKSDQDDSLKLANRQRCELERMKRIFNTKQRIFGVDIVGLENQINEKKKLRRFDDECNRRFEEQSVRQQDALYAKTLDLNKQKRMADMDLNYYRCRFQRKDQRREFDLNDPDYIRNSSPTRCADDDVRLGISSAQIFTGEDLSRKERLLHQREQQRAWLDQQVRERKQAVQAREKADYIMQESLVSRDVRLLDMANSESRMRHELTDSIRKYNTEMAKQKRNEKIRAIKEKNEDDLAEIYNMLTSDLLTENPNTAQSATNPNKKIATNYRGMTPEEFLKFRAKQEEQLINNKQREVDNEVIDKKWEQYALTMDQILMQKERDLEVKQKKFIFDQKRYNAELAIKQLEQRAEIDKQAVNEISKEFFEQFNKTSR